MSTRTRAHPQAMGTRPALCPPAPQPLAAGIRVSAVRRTVSAAARRALALLVVLLTGTLAAPHAHASHLLVTSAQGNSLLRFDGETGNFTDLFAQSGGNGAPALSFPEGMVVGPDGNVYVRSAGSVLLFDGTTGAFQKTIVAGSGQSADPLSFQGHFDPTTGALVTNTIAVGLNGPTGLTFGPDGNLYVSGYGTVMRYNGQTGAVMGPFTSGGPGFTNATGVTFGPDGNLYVSAYPENVILQYNGTTGQYLSTFVSAGSGGLNRPIGLVFGPDGNLYVCSYSTNSVLRYNGQTGALLPTGAAFTSGGTTTDMSGPTGLAFGLDGSLYVSGYLSNTVTQYDGTTGAFIKDFVVAGTNGVPAGAPNGPFALSFYFEAPTGLAVTNQSQTEIDLSWVNNSPDATHVELDRKVGSGAYVVRAILPASTTSFADTGLTPNTAYAYRVQAINGTGTIASGFASQTSATTPPNLPTAPTNLTAAAGPGLPLEIDLTWTNTASVQDHVEVQRMTAGGTFQTIAVLDGSLNSYQDKFALSQNTTYSYQVRAKNITGASGWSSQATAITPGAPAPPTGLTAASATSGTQITLTWVNSSNNQTSIEVDRMAAGGSFAPVTTTLAGSATTFSDSGLSQNTAYTYHIRASNSFGTSDWSVAANATTFGPPAAPSGLTATPGSGTQVVLNWAESSANATGFTVWRQDAVHPWAQVGVAAANSATFTDTTAGANTAYSYKVQATSAAGPSGWSNVASVTANGPPAAPGNLVAKLGSGTQVNLTWTNNSTNQTQLDLLRKLPGGLYQLVATLPGSASSYTDKNLTPNTTYVYIIRADNATGSSPWSNEPSVTTPDVPPPAPMGFTATATSATQVTLSWTNNSTDQTQLDLLRKLPGGLYQLVATLPGSASSYADKNLTPNTAYVYIIRADNASGSSPWSNEPSVTTLQAPPPPAPTGFTATATSATQVTLSWTNNSTDQTQLDLLRKLPGGLYQLVGTLQGSISTYTDKNLTPNTAYVYIIRADNAAGSSPWSNEPSVTTLQAPPPPAPTGFTATATSATQVTLSWTNNSTDQTQLDLLRKLPGGLYQLVGTLQGSISTYTDKNLTPNTTYVYIIRADNATGSSPWSNEPSVTTPDVPPPAPTGFTATATSATQVTLSWTNNSPTAFAFALWRADSSGLWTRIAALGASTTSYTDTTVAANATYTYKVRAVSSAGASDWSNVVTVNTVLPPAAPSNLAGTVAAGPQVTLSWTNNSPTAFAFALWRADASGVWMRIAALGVGTTSFTDTTVAANATYTYKVRAVSITGASDWSNSVSVTTGGS